MQRIIDYYNACKNPDTTYLDDLLDREKPNTPNLIKTREIIKHLEEGTFTPQHYIRFGYRFYQWDRWDFDHYNEPATEEGSVDMGLQIELAITILQDWNWNKSRKTDRAWDLLAAVFYILPAEEILHLKYKGYPVDGLYNIDETRLTKQLKTTGKKPVRYPMPPRMSGKTPKT